MLSGAALKSIVLGLNSKSGCIWVFRDATGLQSPVELVVVVVAVRFMGTGRGTGWTFLSPRQVDSSSKCSSSQGINATPQLIKLFIDVRTDLIDASKRL